MNINNVSLTISAVSKQQYPKTDIPEFAFAGRSNVGKSSLINKLLNRKSLARVSGTPGKTITINFYNVDDTIHLVDLPGYGYAKRSKSEIEKWGKMMEDYLSSRQQLVQTILLVDSRHEPTSDDITMCEWIRHFHERVIVVATKMDKLKKREIEPNLERIWNVLGLTDDDILVPFTNTDDEGKYTVWDMIEMMRAPEDGDY
ncbi:MAG: YihA family ribosome biogenesis GTP-binding protein [Clostridia bacterium]|nr:YihA family ribosome biogenesis GTP-binding protein [Clostridia bacterium]